MKAQTILIDHNGKKKIGEGNTVFIIQGTKIGEGIESNMDWSIDPTWKMEEIKSLIGVFLASLEDVFGERMVTQAIIHYAEDTKKTAFIDKKAKIMYLKGRK